MEHENGTPWRHLTHPWSDSKRIDRNVLGDPHTRTARITRRGVRRAWGHLTPSNDTVSVGSSGDIAAREDSLAMTSIPVNMSGAYNATLAK